MSSQSKEAADKKLNSFWGLVVFSDEAPATRNETIEVERGKGEIIMSQKTNKASNGKFKNRAPEATASDDAAATQHSSTLEEIQRLAYEIYLSRGAADGQDLKDWLQAERHLRKASPSKTSAPA